MTQVFIDDIKTVFRSKRFWIASGIIVVSTIVILISSAISYQEEMGGAFGLFIMGNVRGNAIMSYLAPYIPALVMSSLIIDKSKTENHKAIRISLKKFITARCVSSFMIGASVFIVSFLVIMIGCFIVDPTIRTLDYKPFGLFAEAYYASVPMYILLFILYTAIFGALYALFSMGISLHTKNNSMKMVLPGIIYHCVVFIMPFFFNTPYYYSPVLRYEFGSLEMPFHNRVFGIFSILLASLILIVIGYIRIKKAFCKLNDVSEITDIEV